MDYQYWESQLYIVLILHQYYQYFLKEYCIKYIKDMESTYFI